jgi:hypothetical protein
MVYDRFSVYLVDLGGKRFHADPELPLTCEAHALTSTKPKLRPPSQLLSPEMFDRTRILREFKSILS